jgi:asparagine synthase (glutamine-hydrolysing)
MHGRYLCIVHTAPAGASRPRITLHPGFVRVLAADGVELYSDRPEALNDTAVEGWHLWGTVFQRDGYLRRPSDRKGSSTTIQPDALLRTVWGAFVGIAIEAGGVAAGAKVRCVRDPSAHVPCYYCRHENCWLLASDVALLLAATGQKCAIDWAELRDLLLFPGHFGSRTTLAGIFELMPGQTMIIAQGAMRIVPAWSPCWHAPSSAPDRSSLIASLQDALHQTHSALGKAYVNPLVTVSGGLDSAIVATELARHAEHLQLMTFYAQERRSDERRYAELVAETCNSALTFARYALPDFSTCCRQEMFLPRPSHRTLGDLVNTRLLDQAFLGGHDALLNGYGGDNVFCMVAPPYALQDRIRDSGTVRAVLATLRDLKAITGTTYPQLGWHAVTSTCRRWFGAPRGWTKSAQFLSEDAARAEAPKDPHPWIAGSAAARPGQRAHIGAIVHSHLHLERYSRQVSLADISPLLMVPILEACLSIPMWLWCESGIDRSPARRAATALPPAIASRISKGTPVALHAAFFERHHLEIGEFLAEGMLAQANILDADTVVAHCRRAPPTRDFDYLRLLELADAEIWCRYWSGQ